MEKNDSSIEIPETIIHQKEQSTENNPINKITDENPISFLNNQNKDTNDSPIKKQFIPIYKNSSNKTINTTKRSNYIGSYVNNQKNGKGKLIVHEQFTYEGNFKDDLFDGYGEYTCKQYNYKGTFSKGEKCGKGTEINYEKKTEYKGDFNRDKKNGKGKQKYNDGTIYRGIFR